MTFSKGDDIKLIGSASVRSMLYYGDFDGYELYRVSRSTDEEAAHSIAKELKHLVKRTSKIAYIGDIKCGAIEDWKLVKDNETYTSFNIVKGLDTLERLQNENVITQKEYDEVYTILISLKNARNKRMLFLELLDKTKFHIVRWKQSEILRGYAILRDGRRYTLEEAIQSDALTKLDVYSFIVGRYVEFSFIYDFYNKKHWLNPLKLNITQSLKNSLIYYERSGNFFKALKRRYSLAKLSNRKKVLKELTPILNSDLGIANQIINDIDTLIDMIDLGIRPNKKLLDVEIDNFINRLANVYSLKDYMSKENVVLDYINDALHTNNYATIVKELTKAKDVLQEALNRESKKYI
jgi:soluble P-type ATPase